MVDRLLSLLSLTMLFVLASCGSEETRTPAADADSVSAQDVLRRSLQFHDPEEQWGRLGLRFIIDEPRIGFPERQSEVLIGEAGKRFELLREYEDIAVVRGMAGDSCYFLVDSLSVAPSDAATIGRYRLQCERTVGFRNFYRLLNGLPMSLFQPNVALGEEVQTTTVGPYPCYRLTARLNQEGVSEEWAFFFDQTTFQLRGYGYDSQQAGEFLRLDGMVEVANMKLPRMRHWYNRVDSTYLGSDIYVEVLED